ncbi:hypothetical protein GCM10022215_11040 [Nocardioides fonticola]|uniref:Right-handed parallel beta-helix repeat-containing protein n=1 Tax=Nocardioides fonticola TaxID=450363 RepID=A0ABP7XER3_9ACTN
MSVRSAAARWVLRLAVVLLLAGGAGAVAVSRHDPPRADDGRGRPDAVVPVTAGERAQVGILQREDRRLARLGPDGRDGLRPAVRSGVLVLPARRRDYTARDLVAARVLDRVGDVWTLRRSVVVRRGAALVLDLPGRELRLLGAPGRPTSIVAWGGDLTVRGAPDDPARIVGWDGAVGVVGAPDTDPDDGRGYLRVKDGRLVVHDVVLSDLGFWSGRTGGLAITGSASAAPVDRPSADLRRVVTEGLTVGLYASAARDVVGRDLTLGASGLAGVVLVNYTAAVDLRTVSVRGSGGDGVVVDHGAHDVAMTGLSVGGVAGDGVRADGSSLADGPNPAGYAPGNRSGLRLTDTTVEDAAGDGISITGFDDVRVETAAVTSDGVPLRLAGPGRGLRVADADLRVEPGVDPGADGARSALGPGLLVGPSLDDVVVVDARIVGGPTGVQVDRSVLRLDGGSVRASADQGHAVLATGGVTRVEVRGTTVAGRGAGALVGRTGATVIGSEVDDRWSQRPQALLWVETHVSAVPLLVVLVVPVLGLAFVSRRRRRHRELRALLEDALVRRGREALADYRAPAAPAAPAAPTSSPLSAPTPPDATGAPTPAPAPAPPGPAPGPVEGERRHDLLAGRTFTSVREFAVTAVTAGYPVTEVARTLRVPTSRVRAWLEQDAAARLTTSARE